MEIIDNKYLSVRTRNPARILQGVAGSWVDKQSEDVTTVMVPWGLEESHQLQQTKIKNVPSPIQRDYDWPGVYPPMSHQRQTAEFFTLTPRGFCFNEQGTGKTASAIWASDYLMKAGFIRRVLIVCPLSIMQAAWQADLFKFVIHRRTGIAHATGVNAAEKRAKVIKGDYEYVIINYDGIGLVAEQIAKAKFDLIIIDEANAYKNSSTQRWKAMNKLVTPDTWLWMMTGTPAAQSPFDAYGLAKLCVPHRVPRFATAFKESVMYKVSNFKWVPKNDSHSKIFDILQPAIRFEKKDCLDLPEVTFVNREAPLTPQQLKYYELLRKDFLAVAGEEEITAGNAAVNINKLLQISCGAVYSNSGATLEFDVSNRLRVIEEVIDECSNKCLIFVPFTHTISLIYDYLNKNNIPCGIIDGSVSVTKRTEIFSRFQTKGTDDIKVLIIQPQAAAHGVTLTAADTIIWYAPVTSTEIYLQANARIDRQGQRNAMTIVHVQGSKVERDIYEALRGRLNVHSKLIDLYNEALTE